MCYARVYLYQRRGGCRRRAEEQSEQERAGPQHLHRKRHKIHQYAVNRSQSNLFTLKKLMQNSSCYTI